MRYSRIKNMHFKDLNPILVGFEQCSSDFCNEFKVRDETMVHYVEKGKGYVSINGTTYTVKEGELFIIPAKIEASYYADKDDPWFYRYINFDGELSKDFAKLPTVISFKYGDIFREMTDLQNNIGEREYLLAALLFRLYAKLFATERYTSEYVKEIQFLIRQSYFDPEFRIKNIIPEFNFNPNYLSTAFKKQTGISMQDYLTSVRMEFAAIKLEHGENVSDAAIHCGYKDLANFSKAFKKHYGISPIQWKKQVRIIKK